MKIIKKDDGFNCTHCGFDVRPLGRTSRDHCPNCLRSVHIDNIPGDRACDCGGILHPIGIIYNTKKGCYQIVYKCEKCGMEKRNVVAEDDNQEEIIKLMQKGSLGR